MTRNNITSFVAVAVLTMMLAASLTSVVGGDETAPPGAPLVTRQQVMDSVISGLQWYAENQNVDGAWSGSVGVTAFVVICFTGAGYDYTNTTVQKALAFLRNFYNPVEGSLADSFLNYETVLSLIAMSGAGDPQDADKLERMVGFLERLQFSDDSIYNKTEPWYHGGWPNYAGIPDVSNSQFALLGLHAAQLMDPAITIPQRVWENVTLFETHCQNWPDVNVMPWAHNITLPSHGDGGFVYNPYRSRTELGEQMFESYGSITAAGYYSYLVAGNDDRQPEVAAARAWMDHEYTIELNPRMAGKGLYYYLWTQTRALAMSGQDWVVDGAGKLHDWRAEVATVFMDIQLPNGQWPGNPQIGWREEEPEIAGIYAILSMQAAYMTAPNAELRITAEEAGEVSFVDLEGNVLASDPSRGLTVTESSLTCTDPETFRKLWVQVSGSFDGMGALTIEGHWGDGRVSSRSVSLDAGDSNLFVATGGFAGPFGIHVTNFGGDSPVFQVDKPKVQLVRGETQVIDFELTETTGRGSIARAMLVTYSGDGIVADVDTQGIDVLAGDVDVLRLTVSVAEDYPASDEVFLVISSSTAPPVVIPVDVVDSEDTGMAIGLWYWLVVILLVVLVFFFILLPRVSRGRSRETSPEEDGQGPAGEEVPGHGTATEGPPEPEVPDVDGVGSEDGAGSEAGAGAVDRD
jgi:squalene-hopene/tetraprenyl-beta-curcumene cyclase